MPSEVADFLRAVPAFAPLRADLREQLAARCTIIELPAGDWLFHAGDPGECVYVVRSGRLEVVLERPDGAVVIRVLGRGDEVGELALMTGSPRSASVRAVRDSELLCVDREDFESLVREAPDFALGLTRVLAEQLRASEGLPEGRRSEVGVLAVVPSTPGLALVEFRRGLVEALGRWGRVAELDAAHAGDAAGRGRALDRLEAEHDLVVLVADDPEDRRWTDFCMRQADRLLVLVAPGTHPDHLAGDPAPGCDVAFWGPRATATERSPWLDRLQPRTHHLVQPGPGLRRTIDRLARRILGRSLGIVLSGGGARGLAHIGAIGALLDAGLEIDRVGGCSMGSYVGAMFAMGLSPDEVAAVCRRELVDRNPFNDFTVPRVALLRARKAEAMLQRVFGDTCIEELTLDYFAVSCDLVAAKTVVHRRGPTWEAVGMSMSIPGLVPPVVRGGRILVDGGLLNNMPVDVMSPDEGPVVAVDVMGEGWSPKTAAHEARPIEPGWQSTLRQLAGRATDRAPTIFETLARTTVIGSWRMAEENRQRAQLVIEPEFGNTGVLEFQRLDEMIEAGRRAAEAALERQADVGGEWTAPVSRPAAGAPDGRERAARTPSA